MFTNQLKKIIRSLFIYQGRLMSDKQQFDIFKSTSTVRRFNSVCRAETMDDNSKVRVKKLEMNNGVRSAIFATAL